MHPVSSTNLPVSSPTRSAFSKLSSSNLTKIALFIIAILSVVLIILSSNYLLPQWTQYFAFATLAISSVLLLVSCCQKKTTTWLKHNDKHWECPGNGVHVFGNYVEINNSFMSRVINKSPTKYTNIILYYHYAGASYGIIFEGDGPLHYAYDTIMQAPPKSSLIVVCVQNEQDRSSVENLPDCKYGRLTNFQKQEPTWIILNAAETSQMRAGEIPYKVSSALYGPISGLLS